jgi:leucyl-tRNA synthetase
MPILACALKIQKEIAAFGNPPVFPDPSSTVEPEEEGEAEAAPAETADAASPEAPAEKRRKKKGKLAAKTSTARYQWQIMAEMGVPENEIAQFQDPNHWLGYWPPVAKRDLNGLGVAVDWRRTFITTDANPFYDAFIRWQFNCLRAKDKLSFGKLMSIITPSNKQVCSDHDRRDEGEGVMPQAYTLVKLKLMQPYPAEISALLSVAGLASEGDAAADVILPAATLRPETMYGQTNAFVLPTGEYAVYRTAQNEVFVCTDRSALNMAFQDSVFQPFEGSAGAYTWGECANRKMGTVLGEKLLGCAIKAPLAQYERVYVLPLLTILMDKGTGIVTSVPSDSPADYSALMDMKNKKDMRAKFGITDEMVLPFEVMPVLRIEMDEYENTDQIAVLLCKRYGVKSQNDAVLINKIKDETYRYGFEKGIMVAGPYAGRPVREVKDAIKADMIAAGLALPYAEPERVVVARTDEECVAGLIDQWFLKYGEPEWQGQIRTHVESDAFNSYNRAIRNRLLFTIGWLHEWGCSRAFGLGTRLPFDKASPLIESLSDSTIYMAYYTIASLLQGGSLTGAGPAAIAPEQLTDAVFDHIFLSAPYPTDCGIPAETLAKMRAEFEYWYPMDLRVSGKDLLNNHLVFSLYNHAAMWGEEQLPRSFYANGMLMINQKKMSKGSGNFITLAGALKMYGADATRFALASAGDSLDDANFSSLVANAAILRLSKELVFAKEMIADAAAGKLREGEMTFWDRVLLSSVSSLTTDCKTAYEQMRMLDVAKLACHEMCNVRDQYRFACAEAGAGAALHKDVVLTWLDAFTVLMSPICPFWAQSMWEVLKAEAISAGVAPKLACDAPWPVLAAPDRALLRQAQYISTFCSNVRGSSARALTVKGKKVKAGEPAPVLTGLTIKVAVAYPTWQTKVISKLAEIVAAHDSATGDVKEALNDAAKVNGAVKALFPIDPANAAASKRMLTNAMACTAQARAEFAEVGEQALELSMPFDELATVKEHLAYLIRGIDGITVDNTTIEAYTPPEDGPASGAAPGKPSFNFA